MSLVDISQLSGITDLQSQIDNLNPSNGLVSGGVEWSGTGLIYDVTACSYRIQGQLLTSQQDQVTLDPSDITNDRIDIVYVDMAGTIGVVTGTPSASPTKPALIDTTSNIEIAFILVTAGSTVPPGLTYEDIYLENAQVVGGEWDSFTSDTEVNLGDTQDPYQGSIHIYHNVASKSDVSPQEHMSFSKPGTYTIPAAGTLTIWWKVLYTGKTDMSYSTSKIRIGFAVGGNIVGETVTIGGSTLINYGLNPNLSGVWQLVSIPLAEFTSTLYPLPSVVDELRFYSNNYISWSETYRYFGGFQVDNIRIQEGTEPPASSGGPYLPLSGGTMSGGINMDGNAIIFSTADQIQVDLTGALEIASDKGVVMNLGPTAIFTVATNKLLMESENSGVSLFDTDAAKIGMTSAGSAFQGDLHFSGISANRAWALPDATGTLTLDVVGGYLPLSGGIMTGDISTNNFYLTLTGIKGIILSDVGGPGGPSTATWEAGDLSLLESTSGGLITIRSATGDIEFTESGGGLQKISFAGGVNSYTYSLPSATGTIALQDSSGIYGGSGSLPSKVDINTNGFDIEMTGVGGFYTTNASASWSIGQGLSPDFQMYQVVTTHDVGHYIIQQKQDLSSNVTGQRILSNSVKTGSATLYGINTVLSGTHSGGTNVGMHISVTNALNNYGLIVQNGSVGIGTTTPDASTLFHVDNTVNTIAARIDHTELLSIGGKVGINLNIEQGTDANSTGMYITNSCTSTDGITGTAHGTSIIVSGTNVINHGIDVNVSNAATENRAGYFSATGGAFNYALITGSGDVGIGISAPTEQLHVSGSIRMVDGNEGVGKVLTSDANGVATWKSSPAFQTLTDQATITWDYTLGYNAEVTLTASRILDAPTNVSDGDYGTLVITQDGVGGHTLTLPASFKVVNSGGNAITLSTDPGAIDSISWVKHGSNFLVTIGVNFN
jgi:hypothetical protein